MATVKSDGAAAREGTKNVCGAASPYNAVICVEFMVGNFARLITACKVLPGVIGDVVLVLGGVVLVNSLPQFEVSPATPPLEFTQDCRILPRVLISRVGTMPLVFPGVVV